MNLIALFFAGALLCNAAPHLVAGVQGRPFPTPFATPHGVGDSSALVNFLWGFANLLVGVGLLTAFPLTLGWNIGCLVFAAGVLALGLFASLHFGAVMQARKNDSALQ